MIKAVLGSVFISKCDALRDLVSFVHFKKREKYPRRSVTFSKVVGQSNTPPWVFFTFFKLYKWYQIIVSVATTLFDGEYLKVALIIV